MKYYGLLILKIFGNILDVLISTKLLNQIIGGILFPKKIYLNIEKNLPFHGSCLSINIMRTVLLFLYKYLQIQILLLIPVLNLISLYVLLS